MHLLETVRSPADLNSLSREQLRQLAAEIRKTIIDTLSRTGGHLASNLGTVELTIALHSVWHMPKDKIIWDTGHQAYAHKLLTGRLERFNTLRQYGGISGFLRRDESEYDVWGAGHAGTAISAALGFAKARDLRGSDERVVAVVGDAALTAGMALEALNNAAEVKTDLTVVLNDNEMSIAENVGALATFLSRLRAQPWYQRAEHRAKEVLEGLPGRARVLAKHARGLKHGITHIIAPENTGAIFEEMGFEYIGPLDGHDIDLLIDVFSHARELRGPVLIHVITVKGKGYEFSEADARKYHGVTPFCVHDGKMEKKADGETYTQVFADELVRIVERNPKVVGITAAMPDGTGLAKLQERFPDRYFDVGIAEQHAVTFAAGLAAEGMIPVAAIYSTFLQRAFDQVLHDVAIQNLHVVLAMDRGGLVGDDGATHHGVFDLSYLRLIPNMVIMAPKDGGELRAMLRFAVDYNGPIALRYPRGSAPAIEWGVPESPIELGKAEVLREGEDVAIFAIGSMVATAFAAVKQLQKEGVRASLINARFAKPLDRETILHFAHRIPRFVLVEENAICGGFGSAVLELLAHEGVTGVQVKHLAVPDEFIEHGSVDILRRLAGLSMQHIVEAAYTVCGVARRTPVALVD
ncbi:MAG: 1-deoxy-D-xylulose-5-phosphate synthase [Armatimonadota bacterium]|nr:1-deoxy-D-xylulose-5-phosphate synthase [bacterium]MDW8321701.1 1-deoxy-D-xylulose-5-phosphate synthase [Armatimonadota bacterium]